MAKKKSSVKKSKSNKKDEVVKVDVAKKTSLAKYMWLLGAGVVLVGVIAVDAVMLRQRQSPEPVKMVATPTELKSLRVGEIDLMVEIRDDDAEREQGLSGREGLADGTGMLFVFDKLGTPVFWMKEMKFALDVVWIAQGKVVQIDENVPHPTQDNPRIETMVPRQPIDMVLEVPAGWSMKSGVKVGDEVELGK